MSREGFPRLAGTGEASGISGLSRQQVWALRRRPGFPESVQVLACGPVWLASELEDYFAVPRKPGRPASAPGA